MSSSSYYRDPEGLLLDGSESSIASSGIQEEQRSNAEPCPCCKHARLRGLERPEHGVGLAVLANSLGRLALLVARAVKELGKRDQKELERCLRHGWKLGEMADFVEAFLLEAQGPLYSRRPFLEMECRPKAQEISLAPEPSMEWEWSLEGQKVALEARIVSGPREPSPEMPENWPDGWWRNELLGTEELPIPLD